MNIKLLNILLIALCILPLGMDAESLVRPDSYGRAPYVLEQQDGVRCVYVFEKIADAAFTTIELADWYEYPDLTEPVSASTNTFIAPRDGATYLVVVGTRRDTFAVFDYSAHRMAGLRMTALLDCENTRLSIPAADMTYFSLLGQPFSLSRDVVVRYTDLRADSVTWVEYPREDSLSITQTASISLGHKLLAPTQIDLLGDRFAEHFYGEPDLLRVEQDSLQPIAIDFLPRSYTLLRGTERENELERVIDETVLTGSAPLNILFRANASPMTTVFSWEIARSEQLLASRTDTETRFVFEQTGKYQVKLHIASDYGCECDTVFQVDAKESMLAVPNVFTPNGDGVNDEFRVAYRSLRTFSMLVFDRWQHQVYSSTDPARGWNGTINGRPAAESAYTYIIEAVGTDGTKYKKKGMVNLLRGKK